MAGVTKAYKAGDTLEFTMESVVKIVISTSLRYDHTTLVSKAFKEMMIGGTLKFLEGETSMTNYGELVIKVN